MCIQVFRLTIGLLLLTASCLISQEQTIDVIYMKNGAVIHGTLVESNDKYVTINTDIGQRLDVMREDIKDIRRELLVTGAKNDTMPLSPPAGRDSNQVIHLKDGSVLKGSIVSQDRDALTVITDFGKILIPKTNVLSVQYGEQSYSPALPEPTDGLAVPVQTDQTYSPDRKISIYVLAGPAIVVGLKTYSDIFPNGIEFMAGLSYRLHQYISAVPILISYTRFSVAGTKAKERLDMTDPTGVRNYFFSGSGQYQLAFTPAIEFNTSRLNRVVGIIQFGGGLSHFSTTIKGYSRFYDAHYEVVNSDNKLSLFFSGVLEVKMTDKIMLVGTMRYWAIHHSDNLPLSFGLNPSNVNWLSLNGGIKLNF